MKAREWQLQADVRQAWHGEAFARTERLKPLHKVLGLQRPTQTPEQMIAIAQQWDRALARKAPPPEP